jgi:antitoxin component of RelBE/YafQ-DinJ toxin-antitoxin module
VQVNIRMSIAEKKKAEAQAKRLGLSLSAFIRMLINLRVSLPPNIKV